MPRGTAVLSPRRQGEEVVATGAGLHHQLLEAGDQAGLGGQQGTGAGVPGAAIPPSSLGCPSSNPGLSPPHRPPLPVPSRLPQALTRMHLHGVRGLVQQRHVQALHAVCAAAVGAPKPVHLVLERGGSSSSSEPPSPSGPGAGLGPLLCPPPGPWHLSDADGGLRPWPDAEPVVLQEGRVVVLVNHGPDASLRGQQREVVLLLGPEDQADPCGRPAVRPGRQEPPARARPGPALTVGDAWALRDPAAVEGVAAAVGGVVESPEVPGTGATLRPARGFAPAPVRAARGATACLIWKELFATGRPPGVAPALPLLTGPGSPGHHSGTRRQSGRRGCGGRPRGPRAAEPGCPRSGSGTTPAGPSRPTRRPGRSSRRRCCYTVAGASVRLGPSSALPTPAQCPQADRSPGTLTSLKPTLSWPPGRLSL